MAAVVLEKVPIVLVLELVSDVGTSRLDLDPGLLVQSRSASLLCPEPRIVVP